MKSSALALFTIKVMSEVFGPMYLNGFEVFGGGPRVSSTLLSVSTRNMISLSIKKRVIKLKRRH